LHSQAEPSTGFLSHDMDVWLALELLDVLVGEFERADV
jgi:hypothetical protein